MKIMTTKLKSVAIGLGTLIALSGCATVSETEMVIHDVDDISIISTYAYDKDKYETEEWQSILDEVESDIPEEIRGDVDIEDYKHDNLAGRTYTFEHKTLAEQQKYALDMDGTIVKKDGKYVGDFSVDSDATEAAETVTLKITAPGKITDAPGATIDGKTAIWNLSEYDESNIRFEAKAGNSLATVVGLIAGILLVAGIVLAVWWNRKGKGTSVTQSNATENYSNPPVEGEYTARDLDDKE